MNKSSKSWQTPVLPPVVLRGPSALRAKSKSVSKVLRCEAAIKSGRCSEQPGGGGSRDRLRAASGACHEEDVPVPSAGCKPCCLLLLHPWVWCPQKYNICILKTHFKTEMPHSCVWSYSLQCVVRPWVLCLLALLLLPPLPTQQRLNARI